MNQGKAIREFTIRTLIDSLRNSESGKLTDKVIYRAVFDYWVRTNAARETAALREVADALPSEFESDGVGHELRRLENFGVRRETLALAYMLFTWLPLINKFLKEAPGKKKDNNRKAKVLREAAAIMDELGGESEMGMEELTDSLNLPQEIPLPSQTADALHVYANALCLKEQLAEALNANSGQEIAKYMISGAIRRITGKYHDREASAVLAVFHERPEEETNYRVWRIRNFARLDRSCSVIPTVLHATNSAFGHLEPSAKKEAD